MPDCKMNAKFIYNTLYIAEKRNRRESIVIQKILNKINKIINSHVKHTQKSEQS